MKYEILEDGFIDSYINEVANDIRRENKDYYDENEFDMNDVVRISRGTTKQDELYEYVEVPDYLKSRIKDYDDYEKDKNDFEFNLQK